MPYAPPQRSLASKRLGLLGALSLILIAAGCAQEVGDIDRTQVNKLKKSDFSRDQEFYYQQMIVDADMQGTFFYRYPSWLLKRIRFEIKENVLLVCSTVPTAQGEIAEQSVEGEEGCHGQVAAFPITAHFDVQRVYNTSTGEQSNLIVENYSDRPWFDREYMRVDWSRNLVDGRAMWGNLMGRFSSVSWLPDQEPGQVDPYRTRIQPEQGYIETTTAYIYEPDPMTCYRALGLDSVSNCEANMVRFTNSFVRIPKDKDKEFEPMLFLDNMKLQNNDGSTMLMARMVDQDAKLVTEVECNDLIRRTMLQEDGRFAEDPNLGCQPATFDMTASVGVFRTRFHKGTYADPNVDAHRQHYANHWNIWQRAYDNDGQLIAPADRALKPITYYLNEFYPKDMLHVAREVERQWNDVLTQTAALAKGVSPDDVKAELASLHQGDTRMFRVLDNGCMPNALATWLSDHGQPKAGDRLDVQASLEKHLKHATGDTLEERLWSLPNDTHRQLCAELEFATEDRPSQEQLVWQRSGDLRYSMIPWIDDTAAGGWLGLGPSAADPLTGEIVNGMANVSGVGLRLYGYYVADMIQFINGEIDSDDLMTGDHIRRHIQATRAQGESVRAQALSPVQKQDFERKIQSLAPSAARTTGGTDGNPVDRLPPEVFMMGLDRLQDQSIASMKVAKAGDLGLSRFAEFMARPEIRDLMLADPHMARAVEAQANEIAAGRVVDDDDLAQAYLELNAPQVTHWRVSELEKLRSEGNVFSLQAALDVAQSTIPLYQGSAARFRGKSREEIARFYMERIAMTTMLHEVGHTLGMTHNFQASMDVLNYPQEYWKIEEAVVKGIVAPEEVNSISADKAEAIFGKDAARIFSGETDLETPYYLNQAELRASSIMEYSPMGGDFGGLSPYDTMFANLVYARKTPVWKKEILDDLPASYQFKMATRSYRDLPLIFAGESMKYAPEQERRLKGIKNILEGREWVSIPEAMELERQRIKANTADFIGGKYKLGDVPHQTPRVPVKYCDNSIEGLVIGCTMHDWGSSQREVVNNAFDTYRTMQPYIRSRRGRNTTNLIRSVAWNLYSTLQSVNMAFRFYSLYRFLDYGELTDDMREASIDAANFYAEVLAAPEPGVYCHFDGKDHASMSRVDAFRFYNLQNTYVPSRFMSQGAKCDDQIVLQPGQARYYGYSQTREYLPRIDYVGSFLEKEIASQALFNVSAEFINSPWLTDSRATNISYWTLFQDDMLAMMRGLILGDYSQVGGHYDPKAQDGQGVYVPPTLIKRNAFIVKTPTATDKDAEILVPGEKDERARVYTPVSFNHQFSMLVGGLLTNSTFEDQSVDFAQYVRIAVGDREPLDYGGAELVEFVHPKTYQRYVAPQTQDGKSISVDVIRWANQSKSQWEQSLQVLEEANQSYEQLRDTYQGNFNPAQCGSPQSPGEVPTELVALCNALLNYETAIGNEQLNEDRLQDIVSKLDLIRYIWGAIGPRAQH